MKKYIVSVSITEKHGHNGDETTSIHKKFDSYDDATLFLKEQHSKVINEYVEDMNYVIDDFDEDNFLVNEPNNLFAVGEIDYL